MLKDQGGVLIFHLTVLELTIHREAASRYQKTTTSSQEPTTLTQQATTICSQEPTPRSITATAQDVRTQKQPFTESTNILLSFNTQSSCWQKCMLLTYLSSHLAPLTLPRPYELQSSISIPPVPLQNGNDPKKLDVPRFRFRSSLLKSDRGSRLQAALLMKEPQTKSARAVSIHSNIGFRTAGGVRSTFNKTARLETTSKGANLRTTLNKGIGYMSIA